MNLIDEPSADLKRDEVDASRRHFLLRGEVQGADVSQGMGRRDFLGAGLALGALALLPEDALAQAAGAPGQLTCHVLDTYSGRPGGGMRVDLSVPDGGGWKVVKSTVTTDTGRPLEPLMSGDTLVPGNYMLEFFHADYFKARAYLPSPAFFDRVVHFFNVPAKTTRYHITLVTAPWGYTTYRWKE